MELWPLLGEMGLLGITVDEKYGGAGMTTWRTVSLWRRFLEHLHQWHYPMALTQTFV